MRLFSRIFICIVLILAVLFSAFSTFFILRSFSNGQNQAREAALSQLDRLFKGLDGLAPEDWPAAVGDEGRIYAGQTGSVDCVTCSISDQRLRAVRCFRSADGEIYTLELTRDLQPLYDARQRQLVLCCLALCLLLALGAALSLGVSRHISQPLTLLTAASYRYTQGDFEARAPVGGGDEIGRLCRQFNRMADELSHTMESLTESAQRQERFTGSFAHELKTPLTSIIGYADMLRSKQMSQEQVMLCADTIFKEGRRLEALSMKLMELIVVQKQDFAMQSVPVDAFLLRTAKAIAPGLKEAGVGLTVKAQSARLQMEPDLMETLLLNVLDNARKAGATQVQIRGKRNAEGYQISVADNGCGMEAEELKHITEAFYMVDKSRSRAQGGAGIGLALCSQIAQLHGCRLRFESLPKMGTVVRIQWENI